VAIEMIEKELRGVIILEPSGRLVLGQESMDFRAKKEVLGKSDWIKEEFFGLYDSVEAAVKSCPQTAPAPNAAPRQS